MTKEQHWMNSGTARILHKRIWRFYARLSCGGVRHAPLLKIRTRHNTVLDVGCGAGIPWLTEFGHVTGMDLDPELLVLAAKSYNETMVQDVSNPFPLLSNKFSLVVMNDLAAHIPAACLRNAVAEVHRVMEPGGVLIAACECDSDNYVFRIARGYPEAFQREVIERPGHQFIQPWPPMKKIFEDAGFQIEKVRFCLPCPGTLSTYLKDFGVTLRTRDRLLFWLDSLVSCSRLTQEIANVLWNPLDLLLGRADNASMAVVTLRKV